MPKYDETNVPAPEFRVVTATKHLVIGYYFPYESRDGLHGDGGTSRVIGQFDSEEQARRVADALESHEARMAEEARIVVDSDER